MVFYGCLIFNDLFASHFDGFIYKGDLNDASSERKLAGHALDQRACTTHNEKKNSR